ncbi:hypothetical protein JYU34_019866 [Plutella xylostella]|uniref:Uncharacterized protein n=1 Tax=Plutella xylostella TaxID=51655 RepID=A0ABQ7PVF2_PLUXY|nr:hypothetical protein JYU34_019866 [Plutella xylostella]
MWQTLVVRPARPGHRCGDVVCTRKTCKHDTESSCFIGGGGHERRRRPRTEKSKNNPSGED